MCWHDPVLLSLKYTGRRQIQWKEGVVLARPWTRARWSVTQGTGGQPTPNAVCTQHNGRPIALNYVQTVPTITSQCTALYVCIDERLWHSANTVSTQWKGRPIAQNNVQTVHITTEPGTHQRIQHNALHHVCIDERLWHTANTVSTQCSVSF